MDAIKIAFETILVGAMALPWLYLLLVLFFPDSKTKLQSLLPEKDGISYAIAAVLATAFGYTLGAAASRLAQDFLNDADLALHIPTEDSIRASVYCEPSDSRWIAEAAKLPPEKGALPLAELCADYLSPRNEKDEKEKEDDQEGATRGIGHMFKLQESFVLLRAEENTSQLRHLHQQLMVLRGVALDGVITCALCLFAWNAGKTKWGRARMILPLLFLFYIFFYALVWNHLEINRFSQFHPHLSPDDPPFMECAGIVLAIAGLVLANKEDPLPGEALSAPWSLDEARTFYRHGLVVSVLLTAITYTGWYWTEILYDRMVLDSFYVSQHLVKAGS